MKIHAESITALLCQRSSEDFWRLVFDDGFRALESLDLQLPGVPEGEQKQQHTPQKARLNPYTKKNLLTLSKTKSLGNTMSYLPTLLYPLGLV